jgi:tetratricopeptide (TPR) repeat protein
VDGLERAEVSGDALTQAFAARLYGNYLAAHRRFETALDHIARAIDILGTKGEWLQQAQVMAGPGRCFYARAGRLEEALAYAARVRRAADHLGDASLRAWRAAEAEPYLYKGLWDEVIRVVEESLPIAWEIREWALVLWSSAWLSIGYLKLARTADAKRVLDRAFKEVPMRALSASAYAMAYPQIALAQFHLGTGDLGQAASAACEALGSSQRTRAPLEEGAAHRVLGQVHETIGNRVDADTAFRRSIEVLEDIQSRPELAQTLLAYGRFLQGNNGPEHRAMIERALGLFEEMNATGWIEEAHAALAAA